MVCRLFYVLMIMMFSYFHPKACNRSGGAYDGRTKARRLRDGNLGIIGDERPLPHVLRAGEDTFRIRCFRSSKQLALITQIFSGRVTYGLGLTIVGFSEAALSRLSRWFDCGIIKSLGTYQ